MEAINALESVLWELVYLFSLFWKPIKKATIITLDPLMQTPEGSFLVWAVFALLLLHTLRVVVAFFKNWLSPKQSNEPSPKQMSDLEIVKLKRDIQISSAQMEYQRMLQEKGIISE